MYIYGRSDEGIENVDGEEGSEIQEKGRECRLLGLLHADYLVLCGESEEDLRAVVGRFIEVCSGRGLQVNAGVNKAMLLRGEES